MAIDFRFSRIEIENFRGLKHLSLELPNKGPLAIVGANNAGKSTILDAIAMVMEGPSAHNFTPDKHDYYCKRDEEREKTFTIRLRFVAPNDQALPAVRGAVGSPEPVRGAIVVGKTDRNGNHTHTSALMGSDDKPLSLLTGLAMSKSDKATWAGQSFGSPKRYARWYEIDDARPEVWLLRPSNLHVSLFQWKTGPLQRLSNFLVRKFMDAKWQFPYAGKSHAMPAAIEKAHTFFRSAVIEFPFWKDDLKPRLTETLSLYLGRQASIELRPDLKTLEEWMAQQLLFGFAADGGGAITPLDRMGHGWQSLVRIACLEVLSQYPEEVSRQKVALLFEEPESYLHPHLSRKLRTVLDRLAQAGWLVVLTTHSPDFISFNSSQTIAKLSRVGDDVRAATFAVEGLDSAAKFQERLDERGGHEMIFAQRVVLCEGKADAFALRSYLTRRTNLDLDGLSVSIIQAGDVNHLPAFASMARQLNIPWCAVSDEDSLPDGTIKPNTKAARDKLDKLMRQEDAQVYWTGTLETCLGLISGKASPSWQAESIETLDDASLTARHPDFVATAEKVRQWIEGSLSCPNAPAA
ncbi:ATP-dependent nuclease [Bordetella hinzii]|uniref:ATP-dependent nuclease n=1 Tax=Bordetella hinzii TaxID=103855 RepID=UPI003F1ADDE1